MAEPSFEELVAQLEERAKKLEAGNIPLEESIGIYEEGAALVDKLRALLDSAELRVQRLQGPGFRTNVRRTTALPRRLMPATEKSPRAVPR